ncbi:hypothetical protein ARMGADRAFT_574531 [Armillaria gallica]|uniref:Uncharacterized protein n=1 Tax=Armillaria gallica TaxID=47427 RepID=A0A2H3DWW3_ARMGA|nr:hypothetical protein ARMGADRAFT_574531 [Armillaria gallica]
MSTIHVSRHYAIRIHTYRGRPDCTARLLSCYLFCVLTALSSVFVYTYFYVCDFDPDVVGWPVICRCIELFLKNRRLLGIHFPARATFRYDVLSFTCPLDALLTCTLKQRENSEHKENSDVLEDGMRY